MLSLEDCRKILGADAPDDETQLEQVRDDAYRLARLLLEMYQSSAKNPLFELADDAEKW